jgi:hypothetical protein
MSGGQKTYVDGAVESHFSKSVAGGAPGISQGEVLRDVKGMLQFRSSSPLPTCAYSLYFSGPLCL